MVDAKWQLKAKWEVSEDSVSAQVSRREHCRQLGHGFCFSSLRVVSANVR
jgi:hypothetical protein